MKKFFLFLLILILIAAVGFGGYYYYSGSKKSELDKILPGGALAYLNVKDASRLLQEFKATKFFKTLDSINVPLLMQKSGQSPESIATYQLLKQQLSSPAVDLMIKKLFGREVAMAVYPLDVAKLNTQENIAQSVSEVLSSVVLVTRMDPEMKFLEMMSGFLNESAENLTMDTVEYRDSTITYIDLFQFGFYTVKIYFTRIDDYLVIGFNESVARRCLDVVAQEESPISQDATYLLANEKFLGSADKEGYVNLELTFQLMKDLLLRFAVNNPRNLDELRRKVDETLSEGEAYKALVYSAEYGRLAKIKSDFVVDKSKMDPDLQKLFSCTPKDNKSIQLVPRDVLMYQWFDCYDFKYHWEQAQKERAEAQAASDMDMSEKVANLAELFPVGDLKQIIDVIGQDIGWYLYDIDLQGPMPLPTMAAFVKIDDVTKAQSILDKVIKPNSFLVQKTKYENVTIQYFNLPLGNSILPGYGFVGDYLIVGLNPDLIMKSIDAFGDSSQSLLAKKSFKDVDYGLTNPSNAVFFLEMGETVKKAKSALEWGSQKLIIKAEQKKALMKGSRQRLIDLSAQVDEIESNLEMMESKLKDLQGEQRQAREDLAKVEEIQTRIDRVELLLGEARNSFVVAQERAVEQQEVVDGFADDQTIEPELLDLYLAEAVYPFLEAVEYFRTIGATMSFRENEHQTLMFIKSE